MKTSLVVLSAFLIVGCESSRQQSAVAPSAAGPASKAIASSTALSLDEVGARAVRLANDQADILYHCRPFGNEQPAENPRLEQGHWIWNATRGFGHGDFEARVELAADGAVVGVNVQFLENQNILAVRMKGF